MIDMIAIFDDGKGSTKILTPEARTAPAVRAFPPAGKRQQRFSFTKVFRWPVPDAATTQPAKVEVIGSFSGWRKVPLSYDPPSRTWQITLNNLEGNRTHRYVILVDGKPSCDPTCDGLAAPQTPDESMWQIATPKGPRIMLLFAQTK